MCFPEYHTKKLLLTQILLKNVFALNLTPEDIVALNLIQKHVVAPNHH